MGSLTALLLALPLAAQEPQPAVSAHAASTSTISAVPVSTGTAAPPAALSTRTAQGEPPAVLAEAVLCLETLRNNWRGSEEDLAVAISSAAVFIADGTPAALPPEAAAELRRGLTAMRDRAAAKKARRDLLRVRRALQDFFADKGGRWPSALEELVPGYLPAIPVLDLPGHGPAAAVRYVSGRLYDEEVASAVADTGGWLYFSGPASDNWGLALIDCSHQDGGTAWHDR
ncbi:MAG: hypothetical protein RQ748_04865 [Elusimicrobiales bacterium]|nr:hypothetical protein [Elusimicrobiales bacterium]